MIKKVSLIEILVLTAILTVLASLILPALGKARDRSRSAVCQSSLKQQGLAAMSYAIDNKELYVIQKNGAWYMKALVDMGYFTNVSEDVFTCPSLPIANWTESNNFLNVYGAVQDSHVNGSKRSGYYRTNTDKWVNSLEVESTTSFFFYADSASKPTANLTQSFKFVWHKSAGTPDNNGILDQSRVHTRHNENGNLWFLDGHVESNGIGTLKQRGFNSEWTQDGT